ncbi:MaoC family dehydratase [Variovorax sp. M-6]|uniref:MaoC family dehydratase n=1 Tax=Variovorax sp. M-6 TaxID=3233041 RepID=UPI003F9D50CA
MKSSTLTSTDNYFEDFEPGLLLRHARGKTVTEMDNVLITNMVMNTADGHFNEHAMQQDARGIFAQRVVFGGINLSMVLGLAAQDTAEQCLRELALDKIRLSHPVFHGDTLYAYSEVLERLDADRPDAGIVRFKHYGLNQDDKLCVEAERTVLLKRKSHWAQK